MAVIATYERALAAYRIGREDIEKGIPSRESEWTVEGLKTAYLQGRSTEERLRAEKPYG